MSPLVTVLMPVYNGLPYLREAIESVLCQTFSDFEFLIIDDASTDGSIACVRSYEDSRIRLVRNERNLGQTRSLNIGLELARGIYVARLDQDDLCFPERLQKQVTLLEKMSRVALIGTWGYTIDSLGRRTGVWRGGLNDYETFIGLLILGKCPIWHPSVMYRRDVIAGLGGYDESYEPAADYDLWIRVALSRHNACNIPEPLIMYRIHDGQQSASKLSTSIRNTQRSHVNLLKVFCNSGELGMVGELLRWESSFWRSAKSKRQILSVLRTLDEILLAMQTTLQLSNEEFINLKKLVYRRLGPGARIGRCMAFLPGVLFRPVFFMLAPWLLPGVRPFLSRLLGNFIKFLYGIKMALHSLSRKVTFLNSE